MHVSQAVTKHDEDCNANTYVLLSVEQTVVEICSPGFVWPPDWQINLSGVKALCKGKVDTSTGNAGSSDNKC